MVGFEKKNGVTANDNRISRRQAPVVECVGGCLFFYGHEFLLLALAAGTAPRIGQVFKRGSGRYSLLGVALLWVVSVLTGAFHLCHNQI